LPYLGLIDFKLKANQMITRAVLLLFILLSKNLLVAQKIEAEDASLAGGATVQSNASASGGKYVAQNDGSLTLNVSIPSDGFFNIAVNAAAPSGSKINIFSIAGHTIDFSVSETSFNNIQVVTSIKLTKGVHVIKILKSWGWISIDYFEVKAVSGLNRFHIDTALVTPEPNVGAAKLYSFLYDHYGKNIISGVMTLNSFDETNWLKTNTGKEPALIGLDFMHSGRGYTWYNDRQPIEDARAYYNRHGIPALNWHWRDPSRQTEEFYTEKTSFDINNIFNESSSDYQAMINDIDYISGLLKELQNENIPVIWRPLHEAAGGWFWWGAKGPEPCKKLFQVMFDRMVNHHQLKNLIWVWTREPNDDKWYPGDEYVDIVGRDIYKEGNHTSHVLEFNDMNERYGKTKMVTISECGSFPDPDNLMADGAGWSWFMPWYGSFVRESKYNTIELWKKTLEHDYVITLDEMPDLRTYVGEGPDDGPVTGVLSPLERPFRIFPTYVDDTLVVETSGESNRLCIFNAMGQVVYAGHLKSPSDVISFSGLSPGLYFVQVNEWSPSRIVKK
jgi:mannan endo-1,4-beta-mannosidase